MNELTHTLTENGFTVVVTGTVDMLSRPRLYLATKITFNGKSYGYVSENVLLPTFNLFSAMRIAKDWVEMTARNSMPHPEVIL